MLLILLLLLLLMMVEMTPTGCRPRARRCCILDQYFMVARRLTLLTRGLQRCAAMLLAWALLLITG